MTADSCLSCGAALDPASRFCRHCGAPRGATPEGSPPAQAPSVGASAVPPLYAPEPAPAAGRDRALIGVAVALGALAVAGVAIALALATGSGDHSLSAASPSAVTLGGAAPTGPAQGSPQSAAERPAPTGPAGPVAVAATSYDGARITASVPPDWILEEDEGQHPGYVESKWRASDGSSAYMLVDASPATQLTPAQDAAPVHDGLLSESGYSEIYYGSGDLGVVPSWEWIFQVSGGDERIDYFFERCGLTFGVLGSSPAGDFAQRRAVYRSFAASVGRSCA